MHKIMSNAWAKKNSGVFYLLAGENALKSAGHKYQPAGGKCWTAGGVYLNGFLNKASKI